MWSDPKTIVIALNYYDHIKRLDLKKNIFFSLN